MRGTVTRLTKLETKRGFRGDPSFYVFGMDEDDAAERLAAEARAGTIQLGDRCHLVGWTSRSPLPRSRWLTPNELTDEELNAAIQHHYAALKRDPLPDDADCEALAAEISALRREIGAGGMLG